MGTVADVQDVDRLRCGVDGVDDPVDVGLVPEEELAAGRVLSGRGVALRVACEAFECVCKAR